jgi:MOSC domain-containing protein YiiM
MRLVALRIKRAKGVPAESVQRATAVAGYGILGDAGGGMPTRQLAILGTAADGAREADGLCSDRFRPNLLIEGFQRDSSLVGHRLLIGDAVLEIESVGKDCYPECPAFARAGPCALARGAVFAKVAVGGELQVRDSVEER